MNEKGGSALLGRALPGGDLEVVLTQDRELTHAIARNLVRRVPPTGGDGRALPLPDVWDVVHDEEEHGGGDQPTPEHARRGVFGRRR